MSVFVVASIKHPVCDLTTAHRTREAAESVVVDVNRNLGYEAFHVVEITVFSS